MNRALLIAATVMCAACASAPKPQGTGSGLRPCPRTPNCVSSTSDDPARRIAPLPWRGSAAEGLASLQRVVQSMPRARVVAVGDDFLRAEFRSLVFRFVDDADFIVDADAGVIQVRSAARTGSYDFGVNRRRIDRIRRRLESVSPRVE